MTLQKSSQMLLVKDNEGNNTISIYAGELDQKVVAQELAKVKVAFPALPRDFFTLLTNRFMEKGFTDQRLKDAVNNVIDTCQYPTPTLANFLSFDKRVKILSYDELCNLASKGEAKFESYYRYSINGKPFYVRQCDKELYNLPDIL